MTTEASDKSGDRYIATIRLMKRAAHVRELQAVAIHLALQGMDEPTFLQHAKQAWVKAIDTGRAAEFQTLHMTDEGGDKR